MEFDNLHQFGVVYEMHLDFMEYTRIIYGLQDWLSDCGGLTIALMALFKVITKIVMYQVLDYNMMIQLYKRKELKSELME